MIPNNNSDMIVDEVYSLVGDKEPSRALSVYSARHGLQRKLKDN